MRRSLTVAAAALVAVLVFLRLWMLNHQSLWYDEGYSLVFSSGPFGELVHRLFTAGGSERFQPLYFIVMFVWRALFGNSEFSFRFFSVIFGVGTAVVLYLTARRAFDQRHALWTLAFTAFSAYAVYFSQEMRPYAMLMFIAATQLYLYFRVIDTPERRRKPWIVAFCIFVAIGSMSSIFVTIFTASIGLADLLLFRNLRGLLRLWVPAVLCILPIMGYFVFDFLRNRGEGEISLMKQSFVMNALFVPYGLLVGTSYGPPMEALRGANRMSVVLGAWPLLGIFAISAGMVLLTSVWSALTQPRPETQRRAGHLVLILGIACLAMSCMFAIVTKLNWQPRHACVLFIPLALLVPLAGTKSNRWTLIETPLAVKVGRLALIVLIALNAFSLYRYYFDVRYSRDDYRAAAAYLKQHDKQPAVFVWGEMELLKYYGAQPIDGRGTHAETMPEKIASLTGGAPEFIVAVNREFYWDDGAKTIPDAMTGAYTLSNRVTFPYFTIYHFRKTGEAFASTPPVK